MDFRMFYWFLFALVAIHSFSCANAVNKSTLCIPETVQSTKKIHSLCSRLNLSPVQCITDVDRFGCLRRIIRDEADFTVMEPEDLVALRSYNAYDILVTDELRFLPKDAQMEVVAIAHNNVQHIWELKGKRLCYPGFDTGVDVSKVFLMYFENFVIPKLCQPDKTLLENRIYALSDYFEMACIAGPWSSDTIFDYHLKLKYKNLCAACSNPASCYNSDKYYGWEGALLCLTDNIGDVAWVRLDQARLHFKIETSDTHDYKFLCQDGTTRPLDFHQPCTWISKPWPVIVAKSQKATKIAQVMDMETSVLDWQMILLQLMENYYINPKSTDLKATDDYLRQFPNFLSANVRSGCRPSREVRWCVTSDVEKRKCNWLRDVSIAYGVEPSISCLQENSRALCWKAIQKKQADIFAALPEELFITRKMDLKTIVQATTNIKQEMNRIAAVVMKNSKFRVLKDLKGAKAAFTGHRSVGWNAFVTWLRNEFDESQHCSDTRAIAEFFTDSCVPGWQSIKGLPSNLYSLCKQDAEQRSDDLSAFEYLTSGRVDVAFVNLKVVKNKTKIGDFDDEKIDYRNANQESKYRLLGASLTSKAPYLLASVAHSSIIAHENITNLRRQEIYLMLLEMDKLFGKSIDGRAPAFSLYGSYDDVPNVIFPEGIHVLELYSHRMSKEYRRRNSYDQIIDDIVKQEACGAANVGSLHLARIFSLSMIIVIVLR